MRVVNRCRCPGCTAPILPVPAPTGQLPEPTPDERVHDALTDMRDRYGDDRG